MSENTKTGTFTWDSVSGLSLSSFSPNPDNYEAYLPEKKGPESLAQIISEEKVPIGGTLMIRDTENITKLHAITNNLLVTGLNYSFKEKAQLLETFGSGVISFFDDTVKIYTISGVLLNYPSVSSGGLDFSTMHASAFVEFYNKDLRGTILAKNKRIAFLRIFNHGIWGYPMNLNMSENSSMDKLTQFSMNWVVTKHTVLFSNKSKLQDYTHFKETAKAPQTAKLRELYTTQFLSGPPKNLSLLGRFGTLYGIMDQGEKEVEAADIIERINAIIAGLLDIPFYSETENLRSMLEKASNSVQRDVEEADGFATSFTYGFLTWFIAEVQKNL